jgi:predicted type IV restriction endonuclease
LEETAMTIANVEGAIVRVQKHLTVWDRDDYLYHETPTRYLLIDPILTGLGWDLHNMDECSMEWPRPEAQSRTRVDYALGNSEGGVVGVIEAKSLNVSVKNRPAGLENQLARYVKGMKFGVAVLTNGAIWHIYALDSSRRSLKNKHVAKVDIREGNADNTKSARVLHRWLNKPKLWRKR